MEIIEITKDNFEEEVENYDGYVLIDFWAIWCGPCNMLAPVIEQIAAERADLKVGKVNTDAQPALAMRFGVTSIPFVALFKGGQIVNASVGAVPKEQLDFFLDTNMQ